MQGKYDPLRGKRFGAAAGAGAVAQIYTPSPIDLYKLPRKVVLARVGMPFTP